MFQYLRILLSVCKNFLRPLGFDSGSISFIPKMPSYDEVKYKLEEFVGMVYKPFGRIETFLGFLGERPKVCMKVLNMMHKDILDFVRWGFESYLKFFVEYTIRWNQRDDYELLASPHHGFDWCLLKMIEGMIENPKTFTKEELTVTEEDEKAKLEDMEGMPTDDDPNEFEGLKTNPDDFKEKPKPVEPSAPRVECDGDVCRLIK